MMQFSVKQIKCIEFLAIGEMTQNKMAEILEINNSTISEWKRDINFQMAVIDRARELLKESLPEIYKALREKAKKGNFQHIKLMLEHLEKLEELKRRQSNITFTWSLDGAYTTDNEG